MPVEISRQRLVDAIVDMVTTVRNAANRISVPRYIRSMGSVNVPAGSTYVDVPDADADSNYTILVEVSWNTTVYVTNKASGGFRINFGSAAPSGGGTVRWVKVRSL
ncbi:MAG: hypothetical protein QW692_04510 [Nitrososphaerota archaeon]